MSSTGDILRKKMRPRAGVVGPCLAWWQGDVDRVVRKACKQQFDLDVKLSGLVGRQAHAPAALDEMPKIALPFLLRKAGGEAALFVLDGTLIDGLIEQQILGKVMPMERIDRPVTKIDAGLSEGFVVAAIAAICAEAHGQLAGLSVAGPEQDRAALRLALGEGAYDILSAEMDMGPGVKTGRFEIWVPAAAVETKPKAKGARNADMVAMLQDCEVELTAYLHGCAPTGKELMSLDVGSVLSLPKAALTDVELTDCSGQVFGKGRLGQLDGARAVRLTSLSHAPASLPPAPQPASIALVETAALAATDQGVVVPKKTDAAPTERAAAIVDESAAS